MKFFRWIVLFHNGNRSGQEFQKERKGSDKKSPLLLFERRRIIFIFALMIVLFCVVIIRLYQYQVAYEANYYRIKPSPPEKGSGFIAYVPKDLEDCFAELKKMLPRKLIKKIRSKEEFFATDFHMNLGLWIRNNWGFWKGSHLKSYFKSMGVHHPDDMSSIILQSFHRHLNNEEIKLSRQVKFYQKYWEIIPKYFGKRKKAKGTFEVNGKECKEIEIDVIELLKDLASEINSEGNKNSSTNTP